MEQEKPPTPLWSGFPKEQVALAPILPQGSGGVSGMAPPVPMRRLLRWAPSRPDGTMLRLARTHAWAKKPPGFGPWGVSHPTRGEVQAHEHAT
jgi:hypothetical protein